MVRHGGQFQSPAHFKTKSGGIKAKRWKKTAVLALLTPAENN
jgi:hypothetical protein